MGSSSTKAYVSKAEDDNKTARTSSTTVLVGMASDAWENKEASTLGRL